ncbi:MAG TPA: CDP-alcohol phosphatidyltransferase family protein [Methanoregulaceae archaeon]|nr:MAG: CDP-alcohol phosphatidyltransferase family protein [Methanolinea sp.]HON81129.1 CDP-alcohol phosphatidyltransferase family protein [Methanoregulaceae archaeon]HPD09927.1 CDP-alcohol phosphatidyltransferase family protein [Methanoregulaceae archaeon]HRT14882.1 CDP-alcohol phosphatidyltransferase family protein [Methanoregulaceae archaeon]HRU30503.1 CDP-alcohol phosphatidyltransferase family protein [Methanoregulaceae archaeon]
MTLDMFRPHLAWIYRPFVGIAVRIGLTPDSFTIAAFFVAIFAGVAFYYGDVLLGTFFIMCNAAFDSIDGAVARALNIQSRKGDFLDHVVDRYADILIITGIFAGGFASWQIGVFALTGVLMVSYLGTQAQAVGVGRYYGGILGRADRLFLLIIAGILTILIPAGVYGLPYLGWLLLIFGIIGHFTAIQRFIFVWKEIDKKQD